MTGCDDCGRPYGHEHGFPDLIITKEAWHRISPTGDDGGLLCPSCICKRLHNAGMSNVEGAFMSGPIKSVDPSLMHTMRWVENLRVQGHGWTCPHCHEGREQTSAMSYMSAAEDDDDFDAVNHPAHYGGDTVYEAIKVIEAWGLGFCLGNTVKYISRAGRKGSEIEDLRKARWYLDRAIQRLEGK